MNNQSTPGTPFPEGHLFPADGVERTAVIEARPASDPKRKYQVEYFVKYTKPNPDTPPGCIASDGLVTSTLIEADTPHGCMRTFWYTLEFEREDYSEVESVTIQKITDVTDEFAAGRGFVEVRSA